MLAAVLRAFRQVDVFTTEPYRGNPVAVVLEASGLTSGQMQQLASWTNLSDKTFPAVKHTEQVSRNMRGALWGPLLLPGECFPLTRLHCQKRQEQAAGRRRIERLPQPRRVGGNRAPG